MDLKRIQAAVRRRLIRQIEFAKYYFLYPFALLFRRRDIWLVAERGTDARDNGFYLFRYLREKHPEKKVYYVITADSADRKNVTPYGNVVRYRSLKHYLLFIAARVKISTHILGFSPRRGFYTATLQRLRPPGKTVFLQHGVTQSDIKQLYAENTRADLFICGAKPEYDFVRARFGYKPDAVRYTGFARFDSLHDLQTKKQILIMPTWRRALALMRSDGQSVAETEFVRRWNRLLTNEKLLSAAEQAHVEIVFYPHYESQKYLELFDSSAACVTIADFAHYDVQQLLKESALLVTDYSSVHFDFAYMQKPCVYYQFDRDEFYARQYKEGYFDHRTMGFGEVTEDEDALCGLLIDYISSGFALKEIYRQRSAAFFPLHDDQNCSRIYEEIVRLEH